MKPVKITVEITLTPESFSEWSEGDFLLTERMYQHYIEGVLNNRFGINKDYSEFINTETTINGMTVSVKEITEE
jgi:hypothetical protein